jgi:hypothetical protein
LISNLNDNIRRHLLKKIFNFFGRLGDWGIEGLVFQGFLEFQGIFGFSGIFGILRDFSIFGELEDLGGFIGFRVL